ncbi:LacI family DNA-binding transcriptional regulator [Nocardiopsis sp. frass1]|uniref:LacI family DNA-binding transcriptional regulator n=1 Tax=Nocardiopsis protaetiae TaxID=3382270 RepID=UPI00387B596C
MRVTLKDIAAEAGVSMMTVSNVINGNRARVSPRTIARVERIVAERGYVPNTSARSLAARSSRLIALLVPAAGEDDLTLSPHNVAILGHVERELRRHDYHLILRGVADRSETAQAFKSWNLDGAVLLGFLDEEIDRLGADTTGRVAVVAIDSYSANPLTTGVRSDDFTGTRLATEHLIGLGHRRIVFAGPAFSDVGVVRRRFDGFARAHADAGLAVDDALVTEVTATTYDHGVELGARLREDHPGATAVVATADILAVGVIAGLVESGADVPGEVSVVGFDDLDVGAYVTPRLTTVAQDVRRKAAVAVEMLLGAIERDEHPAAPVSLDVRLVERASTAPPPA